MGRPNWSSSKWDEYSTTHIHSKKGTVSGSSGIYSASKLEEDLDPKNIKLRESRDSDEHPESTPIIVALDVTGSMDNVLKATAERLNVMVEEIYKKNPVPHPQIMFMAVGDVAARDRAPLQVTQFESDVTIAKQLQRLWFEKGGGGNQSESYTLPWYFAARHIKTDAKEKRGKKGYLFTIGDELCPMNLTAAQIEKVMGSNPERDYTAEELLNAVSRDFEVFHLVIEEGYNFMGDRTYEQWRSLLSQHVLPVTDHQKIPEIIVSTLQAMNGEDEETITKGWDGSTGMVVRNAIKDLVGSKTAADGELVEF